VIRLLAVEPGEQDGPGLACHGRGMAGQARALERPTQAVAVRGRLAPFGFAGRFLDPCPLAGLTPKAPGRARGAGDLWVGRDRMVRP
jgi:hypothetical protein